MAKRQLWKAAACIFGLTIAGHAAADDLTGPLVLMDEGSFFVGGALEHTDAISGNPGGPAGIGYSNTDDIKVNQMYVQFQVPQHAAHNVPIVMIHGCCLSGKTWEDTPDGRMGWAEYFVRNHHAVYLPDQSSRARSGFDATSINEVALGQKPASSLPQIFTFGRVSAWDLFRFGPSYPTPWSDEQFPVEALSDFGNQVIPDLNATLPTPNPTYENLANLAILAGGAVVVGHSESGFFPEEAALTNKSGIRGIISIEGLCPSLNAGQIRTLATIPTLVIFGDHLTGSVVSKSLWASALTGCRTFVQRVNAAGGNAQLVQLPQLGMHGNSHMLMQDRNNLQIADFILAWISKNVNQAHQTPLVGKNRANYN
ncbi:MAG TPA: hypothetical protein VKV77_01995 [Methylovirgula sp.]|nr:hypothetical protein [Methylovirgula sp.]